MRLSWHLHTGPSQAPSSPGTTWPTWMHVSHGSGRTPLPQLTLGTLAARASSLSSSCLPWQPSRGNVSSLQVRDEALYRLSRAGISFHMELSNWKPALTGSAPIHPFIALPSCTLNPCAATPTCAGHSMGGAVATLCALSLLRSLPLSAHGLVACVGFATPPLGNAHLAGMVTGEGWDSRIHNYLLPGEAGGWGMGSMRAAMTGPFECQSRPPCTVLGPRREDR